MNRKRTRGARAPHEGKALPLWVLPLLLRFHPRLDGRRAAEDLPLRPALRAMLCLLHAARGRLLRQKGRGIGDLDFHLSDLSLRIQIIREALLAAALDPERN